MKKAVSGCILFIVLSFSLAAQNMKQLTYQELEKEILNEKQVVVLNFWATWCRPCVEELPEFEKLHAEYKDKGVKVILANLDFNSKVETTVKDFLVRKNLQSDLVHVTNTDANEWISLASEKWSGAIPFTLIFVDGKKVWHHEDKTTFEELVTIIQQNTKP